MNMILLYHGSKLLLGLKSEEVSIHDVVRAKRIEARKLGISPLDIEARPEVLTADFLTLRSAAKVA